MKIGIIADGYTEANGTLDYLKILMRGLYLRNDVQVCLFLPSENQRLFCHYPLWFRRLYELVFPYKRNSARDFFSEFKELEIVEYKVRSLNRQLSECGVDLVFASIMDLGKNTPVKWATEFFDCQHKYFPQYFKWHVRMVRDNYFKSCARNADAVFVNSEDAKEDFCKFYHIDLNKVFVLPFCATLGYDKIGDDLPDVTAKYGIDKPFFLISNQFYLHKRHDIAFEALKLVRDAGHDVMIVCTGMMEREPALAQSLRRKCADLNLGDNVLFLGVIPKKDQIELMKKAVSVVQPSEFEGDCSGQIIDAITIGQRVIASDIDVIKEVSFYDNISFFKLNDMDELAQRMIDYLNTYYERPTYDVLIAKEQDYLKSFSAAEYTIVSHLL